MALPERLKDPCFSWRTCCGRRLLWIGVLITAEIGKERVSKRERKGWCGLENKQNSSRLGKVYCEGRASLGFLTERVASCALAVPE